MLYHNVNFFFFSDQLNETGVVVMSLTCDNAANNWTMLSELGAKLTFNGMNTKLDLTNVLGLPLFVTLDVCHLIKLVRNTLGDFKLLKNGRNEAISWEYFENLHSLQETKGLHLANKLRKKHIN